MRALRVAPLYNFLLLGNLILHFTAGAVPAYHYDQLLTPYDAPALLQDQVETLGPLGVLLFIVTVMLAEMVPLFPTQPLSLASGLLFGGVSVSLSTRLWLLWPQCAICYQSKLRMARF